MRGERDKRDEIAQWLAERGNTPATAYVHSTGFLPETVKQAADFPDICHRVAAAEISVATHRVGIIFRIGFHQQGLLHIAVPHLRVLPVFAGQCNGVIDMAYP